MLHSHFTLAGNLDRIIAGQTTGKPLSTDEQWMAAALSAAMEAVGRSSPNPAVGCVIISSEGQLISTGSTEHFGGLHAEAAAIKAAIGHPGLKGATLYVTLEPCNHTGKQPPCTNAIINSGISRIVYGALDKNPNVEGGGLATLRAAGIKVEWSTLGEECRLWHLPFLYSSNYKKPYIALKWAQSLDGHLADDHNKSQWITNEVARCYAHWLRSFYNDIIIGAGTALADKPQLTNRLAPLRPWQPQKIIFDPHGRIWRSRQDDQLTETISNSIILCDEVPQKAWVLTTAKETLNLEGKGYQGLLNFLMSRGQRSVMVEGGPRLLSLFLQDQSYQSIHAFLAPIVVGGSTGKIAHKMNDVGLLENAQRWLVAQSISLGQDTLLEAIKSSNF